MTDHDTQDVSGCLDCPYVGYENPECNHPDGLDTKRATNIYGAPDWCPLRVRPVLVRLVVKENP